MNARTLLFPFSIIYDGVTRLRNQFFSWNILKEKSYTTPVISVGNLSTGGTGKTPHVAYIAALFDEQYKVAILSRGYGRKTKGFFEVLESLTADECGDEPLQYKHQLKNARVFVCEDRVEGIDQIEKLFKPDVVILDDAYQHRYVKPSLNILLTEFDHPFYKDHVLPSGNLRESASGAARAQMIVITKSPFGLSDDDKKYIKSKTGKAGQQVFFSSYQYQDLQPEGNHPSLQPNVFHSMNVLLVTGIARPGKLREHLEKQFKSVMHLEFRDHHSFTRSDFRNIENNFNNIASPAIIITTSKDHMRIGDQLNHLPLYILPVEVKIDNSKQFDQYILNHVRENQGNSRLAAQ